MSTLVLAESPLPDCFASTTFEVNAGRIENERLAYYNADFAKLAQISLTMETAPQLKDKGVTANALLPATYLPAKIVPNPVSKMEDGVKSVRMLAIAEEMAGITGKYFFQTLEQRASAQAYDATERKKLMELSFKLTGV